MGTPTDYEQMLTQRLHHKNTLRDFANSLAKLEAMGPRPRRVLVNGIVRDDLLEATFTVAELSEINELVKHFIEFPDIDPDIIINGIPGKPFDVKVSIDLTKG